MTNEEELVGGEINFSDDKVDNNEIFKELEKMEFENYVNLQTLSSKTNNDINKARKINIYADKNYH